MVSVEETDYDEAYAALLGATDLDTDAWTRVEQHLTSTERFYAICDDDRLVAVFGVVRVTALSSTGYLWIMEVVPLRIGFLRLSRTFGALLWPHFDTLIGLCYTSRAIRWMEWLGAESKPAPNGWSFVARRP